MAKLNLSPAGRPADYWYLDRTRGAGSKLPRRIAVLALATALTIVGVACCANNNQTLQQQYQDTYGDQTRGASNLLETSTGVLTTVTDPLNTLSDPLVDTTLELVPVVVSVNASVALESSNWAISLTSSGDTLKDARVVINTGEVLSFSLADNSARLLVPKQRTINCIIVSSSNGGKWYFDKAGLPLPNGYAPRINVMQSTLISLTGGVSYSINSSDAVADVRFYYSNGNVSGTLPDRNGRVSTVSGSTPSYLAITLKYDGSKWYFDRSGLPLPTGYKPTISSTWKNQSLALTSSDLYDKVVIYFTDYTKDSYSTNESSGLYKPFRARTADGFMVRLKSDGSKWYFDNLGVPVPAGSKWFCDLD